MIRSKRSEKPELIDLGSSYYTEEEYLDCLHQLSRIGRLIGANKATLAAFRKVANPETILDVGCGGGHFAIQLAKQFPEASVTGIDTSPAAIQFAQSEAAKTAVRNIKFEVPFTPELNFPPNSFDVVTSTLVCHHLNDGQLIDFLKRSYCVARKSIILNDLHRHWLAWTGFAMISKLFFPNRLIFQDGLQSIKRSFKKNDWINFLIAAGIPLERCSIVWHWPFRWVVSIDASEELER